MNKNAELSESLEDYLEIILQLEKTNRVARQKEIAEKLNIRRASVTGALRVLAEKKLVNYEPYSYITLTKKGRKIANGIVKRHVAIKDFLCRILQIESGKAEDTACRMEHAMDKKSVDNLLKFMDFIDSCPRAGEDWIRSFDGRCSSGKPASEECEECITECRAQHAMARS